MNERDAYMAKLKAKMDEWIADIDKLEAQARGVQANARLNYEQQLASLKAGRDAAAQKMRELQDASADAWETLREGAETAWSDLSKALKDAAERFK